MKKLQLALILIFILSACTATPINTSPTQASQQPGESATTAQPSPTPTVTPTPTPQTRIVNAEQELLNGDYVKALNEYQQVITTSDDPLTIAEGQLGIGKIYFFQQNYQDAINQFSWMIANFPSSEPQNLAVFYLARSYDALKQYRQAADTYSQYLSLAPGALDSEILTLNANALTNVGDIVSAIPLFEKALTTAVASNQEQLKIKIAQAYDRTGNTDEALRRYQEIYDSSTSDYTKAQMDYLMGSLFLGLKQPDQAYPYFQDAVTNFPTSNDTYQGLVILIDANQPVSELNRGIIDYYAGQYGMAVQILDHYVTVTPAHDGTPHYYMAKSYFAMADYQNEIAQWDQIISDHPTDQYFAKAFDEKSYTQWNLLNQFDTGAQTLLEFVALQAAAPEASQYLYEAGRIYERENRLDKASATWSRIIDEYPASQEAYTGLFEAGICYYRLGDFQKAQVTFQRTLLLATVPSDTARSALWAGKSFAAQSDPTNADTYYTQAAAADPTGYYSIRAQQILDGAKPFPASVRSDLAISLDYELQEAATWLARRMNLPLGTDLSDFSGIADNPLFKRGDLFLKMGFIDEARTEFESLRQELQADAAGTFRLTHYLENAGLYRTAILASRQVLDIIGMSQLDTLNAPLYFNHIRFGIFYRDDVVAAATTEGIDPLLIFSLVRQESMFEGSIVSSAGAVGLMQILPAVGEETASGYGWPPNYTANDLYNPSINLRLGAHLLTKWLNYFDGDFTAALAAYNGGIGNALEWKQLAGNDPDLFLEVIRFDETRNYIRYISENYEIYKSIYTHP